MKPLMGRIPVVGAVRNSIVEQPHTAHQQTRYMVSHVDDLNLRFVAL